MKHWTLKVEEDPMTGDLMLPLPEELLETQGWKPGDVLQWKDNQDGTWTLSKKRTRKKKTDK
jgi:hypothetical protein